ncbi:stealth family protein [Pseudogracilibacillus sp. SE30717A]|uniref:stealth family protein n=1 Tax=Pseudogracilibacillus sp. SE30717A TaxID=3098293 RepID=UPI00300E5C33
MTDKIDFILTWVDGSDPEWIKEKEKYTEKGPSDRREIRYRDWDNLHYWFRGIEKFTPWVNKIHFITWGHLPKWLNINHPKLNIVYHQDYIPAKYLPTFSSHVIELNFHRIKDLSEKFVYFNDDTFITKEMKASDFFINNLPCDIAVIRPLINNFRMSTGAIVSNNMEIINTAYNKNKVLKENFSKWFNFSYRKHIISTLLMLPFSHFAGFLNPHLPNSYLKETFDELWEDEYQILDNTCQNKFRNGRDVNQWLFRYKQLVEGRFSPRRSSIGRTYDITNDNADIVEAICEQKYHMVCINDNDKDPVRNFEQEKQAIIDAFKDILPKKSKFEI